MTTQLVAGQVVYEYLYPFRKMVVTRYFKGVYYCRSLEQGRQPEVLYLMAELRPIVSTASEPLRNIF
ncbi:MAG: hypothetical protein MUC38_08190 [Cyclobacteriaceae bacterium]|nr:hypothetical protein [Cyclobacteriaceae bacterium]